MGRTDRKMRRQQPPTAQPEQPATPEQAAVMEAMNEFNQAANFQQFTSKLVGHADDTLEQLEGIDEPWAAAIREYFESILPELKENYYKSRRDVARKGLAAARLVDPNRMVSLATPILGGDN